MSACPPASSLIPLRCGLLAGDPELLKSPEGSCDRTAEPSRAAPIRRLEYGPERNLASSGLDGQSRTGAEPEFRPEEKQHGIGLE